MASGLSGVVVVVLALYVVLAPCVSAGWKDCKAYNYEPLQVCKEGFCCGSCASRYCCKDSVWRFPEYEQEECVDMHSSPLSMVLGIGGFTAILLIFICCCVCPCCCLYKVCRKPRPVIATSTHTTVVTTAPQHYPRQPTSTPGQPQSYQGGHYQPYHPVPVQPGYDAQPMPQAYGAQPMSHGYGAQMMAPPPPTYQEATGPGYPPNPMPYSQAAFNPGQPPYPLQPPVQPNAPHTDFLAQPAFNPEFVAPPPKMG